MAVYVLEESDYAGPIPDDSILAAEVTGVAERKQKFVDKDTGADVFKMEFSFVITEPESTWEGQRIWGKTPTTFNDSPLCKFRSWVVELMGVQQLDPKFTLETDDLIGLPCRVVVSAREYESNGQQKTANDVKDVIRAKAGAVRNLISDDSPF